MDERGERPVAPPPPGPDRIVEHGWPEVEIEQGPAGAVVIVFIAAVLLIAGLALYFAVPTP